ncbi:MAG: hypothetical protein ABIP94_08590 [Planctomycetota bacterium]
MPRWSTWPSCAGLRQLRLQNVKLGKTGLADLRRAMPECAIECVVGARLFDTGSWFER